MHSDFEHHYAVFADTQRRYDCTFERSLQPLLPPQAQLWFLCIMFIAAFACSVFLLARDKNALRFTSKDLLCGLLIGVMNAVSNLFMLKCLDVLSVNSVMLAVSFFLPSVYHSSCRYGAFPCPLPGVQFIRRVGHGVGQANLLPENPNK